MNEIATVIEQVETFRIGATHSNQKTTEESLKQLEKTSRGTLFFIVAQAIINVSFYFATCYLLGGLNGIRETITEQQQSTIDAASYYHACHNCTAEWFGPLPRMSCPRCHRTSQFNEQHVPPWTTCSPFLLLVSGQ